MTFTIARWCDADGNYCTDDELDAKVAELAIERGKTEDEVRGEFEEVEIELEVEYDGEWVEEEIGADVSEYGDDGGVYEVEEIESAIDKDGAEWRDELTEDEMGELIAKCESNPPPRRRPRRPRRAVEYDEENTGYDDDDEMTF